MKKLLLSVICIFMLVGCTGVSSEQPPEVPQNIDCIVTAAHGGGEYKARLVCSGAQDAYVELIEPKNIGGLRVTSCEDGLAVGFGDVKVKYDRGVATVFSPLFSALDSVRTAQPISCEGGGGEWLLKFDGFDVALSQQDEVKITKITADKIEYEFR